MTDEHPVLARLRELQATDLPVHGGRTLAYVYDSGLPDVDQIGREAVAAYAGSNGLDPTAFPSLLAMENDLVGMACGLLDAPGSAVGTITSGGTESVLLAVQTARDAWVAAGGAGRPRMVLPATAHAAFHKAAHYFGVDAVLVPVGSDHRADPETMLAAVDEDPARTILVVGSAPSYAHGVVDPITELATGAAARGIRCHVDACIGGWVLPFAEAAGRTVPAWTFAVDGVTSLSVDLHKYAYTPKGASILLHRDRDLRRAQFFASAAWPGYTMLNATMQSTKSGAPLAAAWAVTQAIGIEGYVDLARQAFGAVDAIVAGVTGIPSLHVVADPESTLIALGTDDTCDVFTIADEMASRGWHVQPQMASVADPPTLHLSVSAATAPHVDELLAALAESVAAAVSSGPELVEADVAAFIDALDPSALSSSDFDGLLAASGMLAESDEGAELALPERMAGVNALLDRASPAMREALLVAFLDRLSTPSRPT